MSRQTIYLDNAATTPVRPEVREAMLPFLGEETFGNPSSPHRVGRAARIGVEEARRRVAAAVGAAPEQVVFTSGGTEADNLAVLGRALASRAAGGPFRVAVSAVEHKAVLAAAKAVQALGGEYVVLPVDGRGQVDRDALEEALATGVAVVSVMWVNNETGIVQDAADLVARCAAADTPFHTDAVQALGKVPVDLSQLPGTMLSISAHKIGGPKGSGALILRDPHLVAPLVHGGGQQEGVRPGTENVAGIVGLGRAAELAATEVEEAAAHAAALRDALERRVRETIGDVQINGADAPRAPHVSNVAFAGTDSEAMIMHLDLADICCSSGSACTTGAVEPSHVLTALGVPREVAIGSLRFSFDRRNTEAEVDTVVETLPGVVEKVRSLAEVLRR